ncbi:hypothetical protein BH11ARM2_BH11ARM2_33440 [soil metagenome]
MRPWPLLGILLLGCRGSVAASSPVTPAPSTPKAEPDAVVLTDPNEKLPLVLWNGRMGLQLGRSGFPEGQSMYWEGGYQKDGEEKIEPAASPMPDHLTLDGKPLDPGQGTEYRQSLNLRTGVAETTWRQGISHISVKTWLDPSYLTGRWIAKVDPPAEFGTVPETSKPPLGFSAYQIALRDKGTAEGSFARESLHDENNGKIPPLGDPKPFASDIEIDGPVEDQQAVRAALHYLRTSVSPRGEMAVAPMGFSSDVYNGHVFWDADIWVFPALALLEPDRAAAIPRYRLIRLAQARTNYLDWVKAGRKTGSLPLGAVPANTDGVKFPWESSVTGRETTPTSSRFEDHITGDVAFMTRQAAALGIVPESDSLRLLKGASGFYLDRSVGGSQGRQILGTMSPDENHIGDNDLYTNLLAQWCLAGGSHPAKPFFALPRQGETFLTYDGDALRGYKQAAAVLAIYPLQYPPAEREAKAMLDRFEGKVTKNGPAMSDAIHAIVRARLGDAEGAYQTWSADWHDFAKTGLLLFSEKRNKPRVYFTTGAGGMLQAVLYGFCGLRLDSQPAPGAVWKTPLKAGYLLSCRPNLPKAWKSVTLRGVRLNGKSMTLHIEPGKVTVL